MAGKIEYKKKNIVSTRQLYRRSAVDIRNTWKEIQEKKVSQNIPTNKKRHEHDIDDNINRIHDLSTNIVGIKKAKIQDSSAINFNHNLNDFISISETYDCGSQDLRSLI